jgi:hypothetical protein
VREVIVGMLQLEEPSQSDSERMLRDAARVLGEEDTDVLKARQLLSRVATSTTWELRSASRAGADEWASSATDPPSADEALPSADEALAQALDDGLPEGLDDRHVVAVGAIARAMLEKRIDGLDITQAAHLIVNELIDLDSS